MVRGEARCSASSTTTRSTRRHEPIAQPATSDRNAYDRYWFNGYQDDGEFYFGVGAALYPNLGILDCGF